MIGAGVFVLRDEQTLVPMQAASFATEDDFQRLLASFPELLAGDQIDTEAPRRFMLVAREQAIASEEGGAGRWSLDHLFLDQDGIPTLVEVKRGTDTRIRREVVGQMLDYAANSVLHWPVQELRARFGARCELEGRDETAVLSELIGPERDPDSYWDLVRTNLTAGRIRLLFVADRIPPELRRVVEFLNRQMQPAEVLAVELRQFEGQGLKTLVPLVLGQTQEAAERKGGNRPALSRRAWDRESFFAELSAKAHGPGVELARALSGWMERSADGVEFNDNPRWGSMTPLYRLDGSTLTGPFRLWTDGTINLMFQYMLGRPVFGDEALREELRHRLNEVPGISLPEMAISKRPTVPLLPVAEAGAADQLLAVFDWFATTLRTGIAGPGSSGGA